mmetsp:Transcript_13858/g.46852  ORF Transcript_13858/g.46852 Transcript_13858/m.46852 type:complete len:328 (-) Transcript_13858:253-1236(-)
MSGATAGRGAACRTGRIPTRSFQKGKVGAPRGAGAASATGPTRKGASCRRPWSSTGASTRRPSSAWTALSPTTCCGGWWGTRAQWARSSGWRWRGACSPRARPRASSTAAGTSPWAPACPWARASSCTQGAASFLGNRGRWLGGRASATRATASPSNPSRTSSRGPCRRPCAPGPRAWTRWAWSSATTIGPCARMTTVTTPSSSSTRGRARASLWSRGPSAHTPAFARARRRAARRGWPWARARAGRPLAAAGITRSRARCPTRARSTPRRPRCLTSCLGRTAAASDGLRSIATAASALSLGGPRGCDATARTRTCPAQRPSWVTCP